ncbi:MAG: DUF748 domain-containing protein [Burkholderiaceae bacterium]|nr:DUF748 domain-containing protein [Burkholderiaceae bacterium]NDG90909.1 DUF748 domain-containing protein [Burkholderiaceae bacterium]
MQLHKARLIRLTSKITLGFLAVATLFWVVGVAWAPSWIKGSLEQYSQKVGYQVELQDIAVKPFALKVELYGLKLKQIKGKELFSLERGMLSLQWGKLVLGEIGIQDIQLDGPSILFERDAKANAKWNWLEFIESISEKQVGAVENKSKAPKVFVENFTIREARLKLNDEQTKFADDLGPFSLDLKKLSNYSSKTDQAGIEALYSLDLGKVDILIPSLNKMIVVQKVRAAGGISSPNPDTLDAKLNLKLDDGELDFVLTLKTKQDQILINTGITNLSIAPIVSLLPANSPLSTNKGVMSGQMQYQLQNHLWSASGDLRLLDVEITEGKPRQPFVQWKQVDIKQIDLRKLASGNTALTIDELIFDQPNFLFDLDEKGLSNIRRMFAKPASLKVDSTESINQAQSSRFQLDIKAVKLRDGLVQFSDLAVVPQLKTEIRKLNGSLLGVSNMPGRYAAIALNGFIADKGSFRAKGQASFDDPRRNHDLSVEFKNVPLNTANAYFIKHAGYSINDGRLDLLLNYKAKDAELLGQNRFVIKDIQLGEEIPDFQGKRLPLRLAVALLEDSDNVIDISLSIKGNIDSPEFSASGLVWQAISTVLSNIVTAPFRALASLLGLQSDAPIYSVVGESTYLPADQEKLDKLAGVLVKRPNATIELLGAYDPGSDKLELARARADHAILNAAGFKLSPSEPLPTPSLSDPRIQSGIKSAYGQQVGKIKLAQRLITLPDNEARYQQLRSEIILSFVIGDTELKQLAATRASRARDLMLQNNPSLVERIKLGSSKEAVADKDGIPLGVNLGSK